MPKLSLKEICGGNSARYKRLLYRRIMLFALFVFVVLPLSFLLAKLWGSSYHTDPRVTPFYSFGSPEADYAYHVAFIWLLITGALWLIELFFVNRMYRKIYGDDGIDDLAEFAYRKAKYNEEYEASPSYQENKDKIKRYKQIVELNGYMIGTFITAPVMVFLHRALGWGHYATVLTGTTVFYIVLKIYMNKKMKEKFGENKK